MILYFQLARKKFKDGSQVAHHYFTLLSLR